MTHLRKMMLEELQQPYLEHEMAVMRQAAVRAFASVESLESLHVLKEHLCVEHDEKVRSVLFQVVHTLQGTLLPTVTTSVINN